MTKPHTWTALLAAFGLAFSGLVTSAVGLGAVAAGGQAAYAAKVPACTAAALAVRKGRLEGAAGSRFQTVRVTNTGSRACSTPGWTRYRFHDADGPIGHRSARNPGYDPDKAPLVIRAGRTARSVLSWVDPGPVPKRRCHARPATGFRVVIAGVPGRHVLPLDARVCTTKEYRPHGTRLRVH